jgi:hypothetical protein
MSRKEGWYWVRWGGEGEWLMLHYDGELWWSDDMPLLPGPPDDAEISARIEPPAKEQP